MDGDRDDGMKTGGELANLPHEGDDGIDTGGQLEEAAQVERVEHVIIESITVERAAEDDGLETEVDAGA